MAFKKLGANQVIKSFYGSRPILLPAIILKQLSLFSPEAIWPFVICRLSGISERKIVFFINIKLLDGLKEILDRMFQNK